MASTQAVERQEYVLKKLREKRRVSVTELTEQLDVSAVTVRKDLDHLEERSLLVRTHGGAIANDHHTAANHFAYDLPFEEKARRREEEKKRIAERAAGLVDDQDFVILDSGTTTLQVVRQLRDKKSLKVATNSVLVAFEALRLPNIELIVLGGLLRSSSASIVGPYAEEMLQEHSFRKLFLAGDGFDVRYGLTTTDAHEAALNRLMIQAAERTIVVVDSSKFGRRGLCRICAARDVDTVITDDGVSDEVVQALEEEGVDVLIA